MSQPEHYFITYGCPGFNGTPPIYKSVVIECHPAIWLKQQRLNAGLFISYSDKLTPEHVQQLETLDAPREKDIARRQGGDTPFGFRLENPPRFPDERRAVPMRDFSELTTDMAKAEIDRRNPPAERAGETGSFFGF